MDQRMYRATYFYQFPPQEGADPFDPRPKQQLGESFFPHDQIEPALEEARARRHPIARALIEAFNLPFVRHEEIEIHLCAFNPQLNLFGEPIKVVGGKKQAVAS